MRGRKAIIPVSDRIAVSYRRVSSAEQAESGHSLDAQQRRLRAYAEGTERVLLADYCDPGVSAGSLKRPALQQLLADVKAGRISAVYVTKLDRLSRSLADLLELVRLFDKHDVALISAAESIDSAGAAGRMMLHLLGVFAEFERSRTSERTRDVLADRRKQGKVYCSNTPFGWNRVGDNLVPDSAQQAALNDARRMHGEGASLRQIGAHLTALGFKGAKGGVWHAQSVKEMLGSRIASEMRVAV